MSPSESIHAFEAFTEANGVVLVGSSPGEAIQQMVAFYAAAPAAGCAGPLGDTLLLQWGTYDAGEGKGYELNISRQFVESALEGDAATSQLQLTFVFPSSAELEALGHGSHCCESRADVDAFRALVVGSPQVAGIADRQPRSGSLRHCRV